MGTRKASLLSPSSKKHQSQISGYGEHELISKCCSNAADNIVLRLNSFVFLAALGAPFLSKYLFVIVAF